MDHRRGQVHLTTLARGMVRKFPNSQLSKREATCPPTDTQPPYTINPRTYEIPHSRPNPDQSGLRIRPFKTAAAISARFQSQPLPPSTSRMDTSSVSKGGRGNHIVSARSTGDPSKRERDQAPKQPTSRLWILSQGTSRGGGGGAKTSGPLRPQLARREGRNAPKRRACM